MEENMSKLTRLLALTAATMYSVAYSDLSSHDVEGERIPNVEMTKWGSVKFGTMTASPDSLTNTLTGITKSLAAEPKCEVKQEFWGRKYFELTDVNGHVYKLTPPTSGSMRYRTRTGWYLISADGKIVEYKDTVKGGK
jgi:hypothetical protein